MTQAIPRPVGTTLWHWLAGVAVAVAVWIATYVHLTDFADAAISLLGLERGNRLTEAVHFFLYDTPKVLLLLTGIVFAMGIVQTFFSPERTRALLSGKRLGLGNVLGGLGISGNTYTSRVKGLVYATGAVALRGITRVDGCLLTDGVLTVSDTPVIAHDATLVSSPPRGFWEGLDLRVVDGSWKQAVDP